MNALMQGSFPSNYPVAVSSPLPSAVLRPLQQPLYDTESTGTGAISEIIFFQRQLGQTMANVGGGSNIKTAVETNLQQPGQLANPLEFSVFGFLVEVEPGTTLADFNTLYRAAVFVFTYTGNRVYLQIPINRIPQGVSPEGFSALAGQTAATTSTMVHNGVGHVSNLYKFTIGKAALRIRPTESFQAKLSFNSSLSSTATLVAATRVRCYIVGLSWTAL